MKDSKRRNSKSKAPRKSGAKGRTNNKRSAEVEVVDSERARDPKNFIGWYSHNPALMNDAGRLPFAQSLGTEMHVASTEVANATDDVPTPGLMVLRYIPTPGYAASVGQGLGQNTPYRKDGMNAPVNVASREIYSFTRSHNSGAKNYDSPNQMIYLVAMDSVYMFYSMCTRIYGTLRLFSGRNRYLPRALSYAFGVDYDDLSANIAQFRAMINMFAAKASSLYVPAVMDYFTRHFWLTQNLFMDGQTAKAQIYAYAPLHLWKFAGATNDGRMYLDRTETFTCGKNLKLEDLRAIGDSLLNPLLTSEDFNLMSGDILKAYGADKLFVLQPVPEEYTVFPVYEEEVLMQIHNSTSLRVDDVITAPDNLGFKDWIFRDQATGVPMWKIVEEMTTRTQTALTTSFMATEFIERIGTFYNTTPTGGTPGLLTRPQILNAHKDDVSAEDVMEMTRLMTGAIFMDANASGTYKMIVPAAIGTELMVGYQILTANYGSAGQQFDVTSFGTVLPEDSFTTEEILTIAEKLAMFNFAPIVYSSNKYFDGKLEGGVGVPIPVTQSHRIGDMENYTVIDFETLKRLHEVALLSMFNIPEYGKF